MEWSLGGPVLACKDLLLAMRVIGELLVWPLLSCSPIACAVNVLKRKAETVVSAFQLTYILVGGTFLCQFCEFSFGFLCPSCTRYIPFPSSFPSPIPKHKHPEAQLKLHITFSKELVTYSPTTPRSIVHVSSVQPWQEHLWCVHPVPSRICRK